MGVALTSTVRLMPEPHTEIMIYARFVRLGR